MPYCVFSAPPSLRKIGAFYTAFMDEAAAAAERGEGVAATIARSPLVPALARSIILTGEETGRADQVFLRLSSYYDEQVEKRVKTLTTLLEPLILLGMGAPVHVLQTGDEVNNIVQVAAVAVMDAMSRETSTKPANPKTK